MASVIFYVLAIVAFVIAALGHTLGTLNLVDWGLAFVAAGLLVEPLRKEYAGRNKGV